MYVHRLLSLSSHICDTPASEREFTENLHELDHKLQYLKEQDFRDALAVHDPTVRDELEKLKHKVRTYYATTVTCQCTLVYVRTYCSLPRVASALVCVLYVSSCVHISVGCPYFRLPNHRRFHCI